MNKMPKKKTEKGWKSSAKDHYTVVLEDMRSNFKAFGENLDFVRKDVKEVKDGLDFVRSDIREIKQTLGEHGRTLGEHGRTLGEHGRKLDSNTEMIGRIMIAVGEIKSSMREKVDRSEFVKLEKRLVVLEATVYGGKRK